MFRMVLPPDTQDIGFQFAELSFFLQSTEDEAKTISTISNRLAAPKQMFKKSDTKGHFDNPIIISKATFTGANANKFAMETILKIDPAEKRMIVTEIEKHVDRRGALFLRLDKQALFRNSFTISQSDSVRIILKPDRRDLTEILRGYRNLLSQR